MFKAAGNLSAFTDTVTSFISKCIEDVVPTKTIKITPNQKPWINSSVKAALKARNVAFTSGSPEEYKQARYTLRTTIKKAKREYSKHMESKLNTNNVRHLWQGLHAGTDFKGIKQHTTNTSPTFPDELNSFYARFDPSARPSPGRINPPPLLLLKSEASLHPPITPQEPLQPQPALSPSLRPTSCGHSRELIHGRRSALMASLDLS